MGAMKRDGNSILGLLADAKLQQKGSRIRVADEFAIGGSIRHFFAMAADIQGETTKSLAKIKRIESELANLIERIKQRPTGTVKRSEAALIMATLRSEFPGFLDYMQATKAIVVISQNICKVLDDGAATKDVNNLVCQGIEFGRLLARMDLRPTRDLIRAGRRKLLDHPKTMRAAKARLTPKKRQKDRKLALQAIAWAGDKHPTAAADGKTFFLKRKAAEHLGIDPSTLYRWLRKK